MKRWLVLLLLVCSPAFAQLPTTPLGNATVAGTLGVTGATTLNGTTAANAPINLTPNGGTIARSVQATLADAVNVLSYAGVDSTGATDSSAGINAAVAYGLTFTPAKAVYLPAGSYHVAHTLNLGSSTQAQCMVGDGDGTTITVGSDFDPAATGVIVPGVDSADGSRNCIENIRISFQQLANLVTATTAVSSSGTNTITVASTSGIVAGNVMYVADNNNSAILINFDCCGIGSLNGTTVTSVNAGTGVVTLSNNLVGTVQIGDTITFASTRGRYAPMGSCTTTPGGTGCEYPWAINAPAGILLQDVNVNGGWDGIRIRGSTFTITNVNVGAFDVGLDVDDCFNFPTITNFMFYDVYPGSFGGSAAEQIYYDGNVYAAKLGETDGAGINNFQSWTGIVELTSSWSWGLINNLMMDGSNANLVINGGQWTQIGNMYSTKGTHSHGTPVSVSAGRNDISNVEISSAVQAPGITVSAGSLSIHGGYLWDGNGQTTPFISLTGGEFDLGMVRLDAGAPDPGQYFVQQSGASGILKVDGASFISANHARSFSIATDQVGDEIKNVNYNGWTPAAAPGVLGTYGPNSNSILMDSVGFNLALGISAGHATTTGTVNTFVGFQAGQRNTTGSQNTYIGENSGLSNDVGYWNTAVGTAAMQNSPGAIGNTAIGDGTLLAVTGARDTAVGYAAGDAVTTGSANTIIGYQVGQTLTTGNGNILIGTGNYVDVAAPATAFTINLGGMFKATGLDNISLGTIDLTAPLAINIGHTGSTTTITGSIVAGTSAGVSCSGTPTSSFATVNGIVTHC